MAIKKNEIHSMLWRACCLLDDAKLSIEDTLKYVLTILFVKYISDKYKNQPFAGITIPKGATFDDMVALMGKTSIGDDINKKILHPIKQANKLNEFPDFNDADKLGKGKDMVDTLSELVAIFNRPELDFSANMAEGYDIFGDAYEYLMRLYVTKSAKSEGKFYTPVEVNQLIAKVLGFNKQNVTNMTTVYDPACGLGSLLLKVADEAQADIALYGQDINHDIANFAKMNMILHNRLTAEIIADNTLDKPHWKEASNGLKTFDYIVSNPPFFSKDCAFYLNPKNDSFDRFSDFGKPITKNGNHAFLMHIVKSMENSGKAAVVFPFKFLCKKDASAKIRKNLINKGYIKGIIGLPANLFYGTGIPACIVVLDKQQANTRQAIFMLDASKGFIKDGNKNRLREQDVRKIVDVFSQFTEISGYSRLVEISEISNKENDFNLDVSKYIKEVISF